MKEDRNEVVCRIYIMAGGGLLHDPCVTLALCTVRPLNGISSFRSRLRINSTIQFAFIIADKPRMNGECVRAQMVRVVFSLVFQPV